MGRKKGNGRISGGLGCGEAAGCKVRREEDGEGQALQGFIHVLKGGFGLLEEAIDDASAEVAVILIVVHFNYLFEGGDINLLAGGIDLREWIGL